MTAALKLIDGCGLDLSVPVIKIIRNVFAEPLIHLQTQQPTTLATAQIIHISKLVDLCLSGIFHFSNLSAVVILAIPQRTEHATVALLDNRKMMLT